MNVELWHSERKRGDARTIGPSRSEGILIAPSLSPAFSITHVSDLSPFLSLAGRRAAGNFFALSDMQDECSLSAGTAMTSEYRNEYGLVLQEVAFA